MYPQSKAQLRSLFRQCRQAIPKNEQVQAASAVSTLALSLPHWRDAQKVALYMANDGEVDSAAIARHGFATGVQIFLPVIENNKKIIFVPWLRDDTLVENRYGILEPPIKTSPQPASTMNIIFTPLVAWDRKGGRLGMGGGYYDRALAGNQGPALIGLAHSVQETSSLPQQTWDIALDIVITEREIHYCDSTAAR